MDHYAVIGLRAWISQNAGKLRDLIAQPRGSMDGVHCDDDDVVVSVRVVALELVGADRARDTSAPFTPCRQAKAERGGRGKLRFRCVYALTVAFPTTKVAPVSTQLITGAQ